MSKLFSMLLSFLIHFVISIVSGCLLQITTWHYRVQSQQELYYKIACCGVCSAVINKMLNINHAFVLCRGSTIFFPSRVLMGNHNSAWWPLLFL